MENELRMTNHPELTINRGNQVSFQFDGRCITAYEGETIAAALYAAGVRIFSRSFKYHRPRGLFCLFGHCSHCLMRVDGVPNVRTCMEPVRSGMQVESQNAWPSLKFDLASLAGFLDFLVRPGFQYRRLIRPRWAYHIWEKFLRQMAGIGTLAEDHNPSPSKRRVAAPEILVVGGGTAGLSAALHASQAGAQVWLVERESVLGGRALYDTSVIEVPGSQTKTNRCDYAKKLAQEVEGSMNCRVLKNATAFAWYDEGILAVSRPAEFWELKPGRVIVATGSYENPMIFENNDLPGIFTAGALQRLMHGYYIRPGRKAVVATCHKYGYTVASQLMDAGVTVTGIVDDRSDEKVLSFPEARKLKEANIPLYPGHILVKAAGRRRIKGVLLKPVSPLKSIKSGTKLKIPCDVLCIAGELTPANELLFQRTCEGTFILESPHQFTRRPVTNATMRVDTDMYVAGGAGGSQGVNRAWLEGKIAGLSAALDLGYGREEFEAIRDDAAELMADL
jgi:sarcosine oxidase subunit alpha